jgi:hypothetical protein
MGTGDGALGVMATVDPLLARERAAASSTAATAITTSAAVKTAACDVLFTVASAAGQVKCCLSEV